jgi:hypothetical protein
MGQWRGARQAVQPPHTLWCRPRINRFPTWSKTNRFWLGENRTSIFFLPLIYPATPLRAAARHGRFRRTVFQRRNSFWVGQGQLNLSATEPTSRFAHTFCALAGKKVDPIFRTVKNRSILTWPKLHLDFFFSSPSYTLRHRFARQHATAGSAARFFSSAPDFGCDSDNSARAAPTRLRGSHTHFDFGWQKRGRCEKKIDFGRWSKISILGLALDAPSYHPRPKGK